MFRREKIHRKKTFELGWDAAAHLFWCRFFVSFFSVLMQRQTTWRKCTVSKRARWTKNVFFMNFFFIFIIHAAGYQWLPWTLVEHWIARHDIWRQFQSIEIRIRNVLSTFGSEEDNGSNLSKQLLNNFDSFNLFLFPWVKYLIIVLEKVFSISKWFEYFSIVEIGRSFGWVNCLPR